MQATLASSDYEQVLQLDIYPLKVDWYTLIDDITRQGITPSNQAKMLGKSYSTFQRWIKGAEPQFKHGHAILILHQKICGQQKTIKRFQECVVDD